jgi:ABC-type glycerol-3-phosphate transport system substrate-binding protein
MKQKVSTIILITILILLCMGCRNQSHSSTSSHDGDIMIIDDDDQALTYRNSQLGQLAAENVIAFEWFQDELVLMSYGSELRSAEEEQEVWVSYVKVIRMDPDGKVTGETEILLPSMNTYIMAANLDHQGNIWALVRTITRTGTDEDDTYSVERYESNGEHLQTIIPDISGFRTLSGLSLKTGDRDYFDFYITADDLQNCHTAFFDEEGNSLYELEGVGDVLELSDGRIVAKSKTENGINLLEIDVENRSKSTAYQVQVDSNSILKAGNTVFDLLEVSADGVHAYQLDSGKRVKLLDWLGQGINFAPVDRYIVMAGEQLYVLANMDLTESKELCLYRLTPTEGQLFTSSQTDDPNITASGKKRIVLAAFGSSETMRNAVIHFNQQNQEFEIETKLYDYDDLNNFHLDLVSGNVPDIYFMGQVAPVELYAGKDLFVDLYEFLDRDTEIGRDDYIESLLKASEIDGKLYAIPESFYVNTLVGRVSDVGIGTGWSWNDFFDLMASKPEGTIPIAACELNSSRPKMNAEDFFNNVFRASSDAFIDFEKMECSFDSSAFINILEASKRFYPQNVNYEVTPEAYLQGNPVLIMQYNLGSFISVKTTDIETQYFGEEMTYIGYPTLDGKGGSSFECWNYIAISAESDVQDEAWDFLKYILTDYQNVLIKEGRYGFPIKRSALEEYAKIGMESSQYPPEGYTDPQGIFHRPPLEKDVQKIIDLIDSITEVTMNSYRTSGVWTIIRDELPSFYYGERTAEEVAAIIQNRVSIFLMEME